MTSSGRGGRFGQRLALIVTNSIKVAGLVIAVKTAFAPTQQAALEFGLAAFMMAGAQLSEETVMKLVDRMFMGPKDPPPPEPPHVPGPQPPSPLPQSPSP